MNREKKILLLKAYNAGTIDISVLKRELALIDGSFQILIGKDLQDYLRGQIDVKTLIFINGRPGKILSGKPGLIDEVYV